jgi:formate hydrogenlyase subunit 6/NADH:ubiquinone oxidoreductase subunit I
MHSKGANSSYWGNIREGFASLLTGLRLSWKHLLAARKRRIPIGVADKDYFAQQTGIVTLTYPHEAIPVPDHGRYRLHNEIDDCIVCDKCAKICPVNCIEIEPVRATEEIGKTSDGSSKRIYAARFDIDMGKCCFCGLCTTVCPTECLTMTPVYDFSEYDVADHRYAFSDMTPMQILEKKQELEAYTRQKEEAKEAARKVVPSRKKPDAE